MALSPRCASTISKLNFCLVRAFNGGEYIKGIRYKPRQAHDGRTWEVNVLDAYLLPALCRNCMAARSLFYAPAECRINRKYVATWWFFQCNAPKKIVPPSISLFPPATILSYNIHIYNAIFKLCPHFTDKIEMAADRAIARFYLQYSRGLFICIIEEILEDLYTRICTKSLSIMHRWDKDPMSEPLILYEMIRHCETSPMSKNILYFMSTFIGGSTFIIIYFIKHYLFIMLSFILLFIKIFWEKKEERKKEMNVWNMSGLLNCDWKI